jgi:hypothetical protein
MEDQKRVKRIRCLETNGKSLYVNLSNFSRQKVLRFEIFNKHFIINNLQLTLFPVDVQKPANISTFKVGILVFLDKIRCVLYFAIF